jgi:hypothetical protein
VKPIRDMTIGELAAYVSTHLQQQGIDVVLSGGACVAIYSQGAYMSRDLDFIELHYTKRQDLRTALAKIGFSEHHRYFVHPETDFFLEFPAGPLAVGGEPVREVATLVLSTGTLKLISPTDSVKDRLAAYYFWDDRQSLEQAVLIAQANTDIDLGEIARWSQKEGKYEKFLKIKSRLQRLPA